MATSTDAAAQIRATPGKRTFPAWQRIPACAAISLVLQPAVRRALVGRSRSRDRPEAGRFSRRDADSLLDLTWSRFPELRADRSRELASGARHSLAMAALTLAFFRTLLDAGIERTYAVELTADVAWRLLAPAARVVALATTRRGDTPDARLRRRVDVITRYPFGPPSFKFAQREEVSGLALDIQRCPIAEYMATRNAADLCVGAWCNADFAVAESWAGRLKRNGTLAGGARRCDFRFIADRAAEYPHSPSAPTNGHRLRGGVERAI